MLLRDKTRKLPEVISARIFNFEPTGVLQKISKDTAHPPKIPIYHIEECRPVASYYTELHLIDR